MNLKHYGGFSLLAMVLAVIGLAACERTTSPPRADGGSGPVNETLDCVPSRHDAHAIRRVRSEYEFGSGAFFLALARDQDSVFRLAVSAVTDAAILTHSVWGSPRFATSEEMLGLDTYYLPSAGGEAVQCDVRRTGRQTSSQTFEVDAAPFESAGTYPGRLTWAGFVAGLAYPDANTGLVADYDVLVLDAPVWRDASVRAAYYFFSARYYGLKYYPLTGYRDGVPFYCDGVSDSAFIPDPPPFDPADLGDDPTNNDGFYTGSTEPSSALPITVPITPEFLAACKPE